MEKATKEKLVSEFNEIFSQVFSGILIDYKGMTVDELTNLRKKLFSSQSQIRIIKNKLAKRAAKGTPCEGLSEDFVNTRAFVYSSEDPVAPAKLILKEAEENDKIKLIGGVLNSTGTVTLMDVTEIKALGKLPSKEVLISKLLYVLNAPTTNFVRVLNEIPASLARVLQAAADSKK